MTRDFSLPRCNFFISQGARLIARVGSTPPHQGGRRFSLFVVCRVFLLCLIVVWACGKPLTKAGHRPFGNRGLLGSGAVDTRLLGLLDGRPLHVSDGLLGHVCSFLLPLPLAFWSTRVLERGPPGFICRPLLRCDIGSVRSCLSF